MINKQASNLEGGQLGFTWVNIPAGETCQAATLGESVTLVMATDGSVPGGMTWPDPSTVATGVQYGPTGSDYVGTKPPGGAYLRCR